MSQNTIIQDNEQNEVLTVFSYNGVSFNFDIEDIEDLQRYENAYEHRFYGRRHARDGLQYGSARRYDEQKRI